MTGYLKNPRSKIVPKTIRLVCDDEAVRVLERLRERAGFESQAEVLRHALGIYNSLAQLLDAASAETKIAFVDRKAQTVQEVKIPGLKRARPRLRVL